VQTVTKVAQAVVCISPTSSSQYTELITLATLTLDKPPKRFKPGCQQKGPSPNSKTLTLVSTTATTSTCLFPPSVACVLAGSYTMSLRHRVPRSLASRSVINMHQSLHHPRRHCRHFRSTSASPHDATRHDRSTDHILGEATWSVRALLPTASSVDSISPARLHQLLQLSALPPPQSPEQGREMIKTLRSQLQFVRDVQNVDTTGIEPLQAIRDESSEAKIESIITLDKIRNALASETQASHYARPKRVRGAEKGKVLPSEDWNPLSTASRTAGKFFIVENKSD
jgi:Asp-tRNA(Asn)/Glu-tRNA(Gln) amidotransferase C subunit